MLIYYYITNYFTNYFINYFTNYYYYFTNYYYNFIITNKNILMMYLKIYNLKIQLLFINQLVIN